MRKLLLRRKTNVSIRARSRERAIHDGLYEYTFGHWLDVIDRPLVLGCLAVLVTCMEALHLSLRYEVRFTLAHELGHLVLDGLEGAKGEKLAHRFAGAFLMPAEMLWREVGKHRDALSIGEFVELKALYKVSIQAITYRLKDLQIIGEPLFKRLFHEFERRGWRKPPYAEPGAIKLERPERFTRLCYRAASEGVISESKAAELLGITARELERRLDSPA